MSRLTPGNRKALRETIAALREGVAGGMSGAAAAGGRSKGGISAHSSSDVRYMSPDDREMEYARRNAEAKQSWVDAWKDKTKDWDKSELVKNDEGVTGWWRTTENGHKIFIAQDGTPPKKPGWFGKKDVDLDEPLRKLAGPNATYKQPTEQEIASAKKKAKNTRWKKPDLKEEAVEITRTAEHLGISEKNLLKAFHAAELEDLDEDTWSKLENTDSFDTDTYAKADAKAREYDRDIARILRSMGDTLPASIVLFRKGKAPYLVGGNTRLMASRALGAKPKVLALHV